MNNTKNDHLIIENLSLVEKIAARYRIFSSAIDFEDLKSEGYCGLLEATRHYNPKKKVKFSIYAKFWINKYIKEYIFKNVTILKVPAYVFRNLKRLTELIERDIPLNQIAKELNLEVEKVKQLTIDMIKIKNQLSLDSFIGNSEENTLYDIIPEKPAQDQQLEKIHSEQELKALVTQLLNKLSNEEREIIEWRFGLKDNKHHTLKEIAKKLCLTPQKVKVIEQTTVLKLKQLANEYNENISSR